MEENSTWKSCISAKYGYGDGDWFTPLPRGNHGVGLWKYIAKEYSQLKKDCIFKMGDGRNIRFWEDILCGSELLCEAFSVLYTIVDTKGVKAADVWEVHGGLGAWDPKFLRSFNDWEMDAIQAFIVLTSNNVIAPLVKDKLIWMGMFLVASLLRLTLITWKVSPHLQSLPKCFGTPMSPQKLVFYLGSLEGQGPHCIPVKEKGFSPSKQMPVLWEERRRDRAYSDPLSFNLGSVD